MKLTNIAFNDALAVTLDSANRNGKAPRKERVALSASYGRILAENVVSDTDMPPFPKSAMDGYACRREDLASPLKVVGEVAAGEMPNIGVGPGECIRIMTGAPLPDGADFVVMVENTQLLEDAVVKVVGPASKSNICRQGEDVRTGDVVMKAGVRLTPAHLAMLAAVGVDMVPVYKAPVVGVIATGRELVAPGTAVSGAQIRNSNSFQTAAQILSAGAIPRTYGIVTDILNDTRHVIAEAKSECDVVIVSGGVSMGKYDLVPDALMAEGFDLQYTSVAMQPGKPTVFGISADGKFCFGLPGNPVSALVVFELIVRPFLLKRMGHDYHPRIVRATLAGDFKRKKALRPISVPVRFVSPGEVAIVDYHGAAHIAAFCDAEGMVTIPKGVQRIEKGTAVDVRCL